MAKPKPKTTKRVMTDEHKQAIAAGRSEGAVVKRYLEALQVKGKPGRPLDPARLQAKLEDIDNQLAGSQHPLTRLELEQQRLDLEEKLNALTQTNIGNIADLEDEFIRVGKSYAARKAISYAAFRKVGVPAAVLKQAGIPRNQA